MGNLLAACALANDSAEPARTPNETQLIGTSVSRNSHDDARSKEVFAVSDN